MLKREVVTDYILECLSGLTADKQRPVGLHSNLIEDLGLESIKIMDLLMMLEDQHRTHDRTDFEVLRGKKHRAAPLEIIVQVDQK